MREISPILYFFPGISTGMGLQVMLPKLPGGMSAKFKGCQVARRDVIGPDKSKGALLSAFTDGLIEVDRETHDWRRLGEYWMGVVKNHNPAMFAKAGVGGSLPCEGYPVTLGDGNEWIIPVALLDMPNFRMPWKEVLGEGATIERVLDPRFEHVCKAARVIVDSMGEDGTFAMDELELRAACASAIAVNYRLDVNECVALGLFTSESYQDIVSAIIDMPGLRNMLKKKAGGGLNTDCGELED